MNEDLIDKVKIREQDHQALRDLMFELNDRTEKANMERFETLSKKIDKSNTAILSMMSHMFKLDREVLMLTKNQLKDSKTIDELEKSYAGKKIQ